ncbi:MAG: cytochrome c [Deltaproteobacteria bacterium]|nr:cytochrome c [Deltaproteobacteria bacterium]
MKLRCGLTASTAVLTAIFSVACERPNPPAGGAALFAKHCASCHGATGVGDGPLAAELRTPPADLTRIAERNGGKFDEAAVMSAIDGRRAVAAHGPRDMPVWSEVFQTEFEQSGMPRPHATALERSRLMADYLRTIQAK